MSVTWVVLSITFLYLGFLFAIVWNGEQCRACLIRWLPWIYSFSISIYCISWRFWSADWQTSEMTWSFLLIYLGPIFIFTFFWRVLARMIGIANREKMASIMDFISARYGQPQKMIDMVIWAVMIGLLPLMTLQLAGIAMGSHRLVPSLYLISLTALSAMAQFSPALILGLYWRPANQKGVFAGLCLGFMTWLCTVYFEIGRTFDVAILFELSDLFSPPALPFLTELSPFYWGLLLSVVLNLSGLILVSIFNPSLFSERLQAANFVGMPFEGDEICLYQSRVTIGDLEILVARFVGFPRARQSFKAFAQTQNQELAPKMQASPALIHHTEHMLAEVFGASTAKLILTSALQGRHIQLKEVVTIVDEVSELFDFSRGLLQGAIAHIHQGISVVDKQLRLVAWNQRYIELFDFPENFIRVGCPIADVIRYNAARGFCGEGNIETQIEKRVAFLRQGAPHRSSRVYPDGRVIEVQGNPMPGGGFVMSFSDISAFCHAEAALKLANENLEARVMERTQALQRLNQRLLMETEKAAHASQSKSRFLAAVSHDLMQPLNAARLFASSLSEIAVDQEGRRVSRHILSALEAAEDLISDLLDISRLESEKMKPKITDFPLEEIFLTLDAEFGMIACEQGIQFRVQHTGLYIRSDKRLLRRVLQNFLTNAFRYNPKGRVLLGVRRVQGHCRIEVWDNGPGIPADKQQDIFDEFTRIERKGSEMGLGLGLAIARGISRILGQRLSLRSWPKRATVFGIDALKVLPPQTNRLANECHDEAHSHPLHLFNIKVLCVDNDKDILLGMASLLSRWGCQVQLAEDLETVIDCLNQGFRPNMIFSDYHLTSSLTGLDILAQCQEILGEARFMGAVITADRNQETQNQIRHQGYAYITKPVKPLKLRALLQQEVH